MFQFFDEAVPTGPVSDHLTALKTALTRRGLDGFIIPHADAHQNEYLPACAERLAWATGFTGSAGTAIVLADRTALFVDGRYRLQAQEQFKDSDIEIIPLEDTTPHKWLEQSASSDQKIGYDPWLHTVNGAELLIRACATAGAELVAISNPIDALWTDQPDPPTALFRVHDLRYAGKPHQEKRGEIGESVARAKAQAVVLTTPDSIAWVLNIRGGDVTHAPLPLGYVILHADGTAELYANPRKITDEIRLHLGDDVTIHGTDDFGEALDELGQKHAALLIDPARSSVWIYNRLKDAGATLIKAPDPCLLPKAIKNEAELSGMRAAHVRDGAALSRFLCWLDQHVKDGAVDEITAVTKLESFRQETGALQDISFDTIAGSGPHGAIVHYRVTTDSNRMLQQGELFLLDSGAQYLDGTTDVTRTVAVGAPSMEMRDRFTRVLKGHITLATARFPKGTSGEALDILARKALWDQGLDYDHGTGHGVGAYLSVHEGPQGISKRASGIDLKPGMIISNEPGFYKTGAFGIRIESLVCVTPAANINGGMRPMMGFETLTLAPIDLALIDKDLLNDSELAWLNAYHKRVRETLTPLVDGTTAAWLKQATRAL